MGVPEGEGRVLRTPTTSLSTASTSSTWMPSPTALSNGWPCSLPTGSSTWRRTSWEAAKSYVAARYPAELGKADVIIGYRADDSYFSFARAFLENRISLAQLERAMKLGGLGRQVVAVSEAAFGALTFAGAETAPASQWHERRMAAGREGPARFRSHSARRAL